MKGYVIVNGSEGNALTFFKEGLFSYDEAAFSCEPQEAYIFDTYEEALEKATTKFCVIRFEIIDHEPIYEYIGHYILSAEIISEDCISYCNTVTKRTIKDHNPKLWSSKIDIYELENK